MAKRTREVKFLYTGIVLLVIIALFLILVLFSPLSPTRTTPSQPTLNSEQTHELLSAPATSTSAEISHDTLNSLEGKNEPAVPSQDMMNMLSAPPPKK